MIAQTIKERKAWVIENFLIIPIVTALGLGIIAFDRRDPINFVAGEIIPANPQAGKDVTVRWTTEWSRACEAVVSREVVGSDLIVKGYLKYDLRIPTRLGQQTSDTTFTLAQAHPSGLTAYRANLHFHSCGLTSRLWPITVETPPLYFQVAR